MAGIIIGAVVAMVLVVGVGVFMVRRHRSRGGYQGI